MMQAPAERSPFEALAALPRLVSRAVALGTQRSESYVSGGRIQSACHWAPECRHLWAGQMPPFDCRVGMEHFIFFVLDAPGLNIPEDCWFRDGFSFWGG